MQVQPGSPSVSPDEREQRALLKALMGTVHHFFAKWRPISHGVSDPRNPDLVKYLLAQLLCVGVLLFVFRLGSRREVNYKLRGNGLSVAKFATWFGVQDVPHGDTVNYAFQRVVVDEVQGVVCQLVEVLIRKKVLYRLRLLGAYYRVVIDGAGVLTFHQRHCSHCLTWRLSNGEILYYGGTLCVSLKRNLRFLHHPVLEAKLVTPNGFVFSMMTELIENADLQGDKQDCELKAFYRLAERLKARFPPPADLLAAGWSVCRWAYFPTLPGLQLAVPDFAPG